MIKIERVLISELKKYYKSEEVEEYCKNCGNYGNIWSCPPHSFDREAYVDKYRIVYIVRLKVDVKNAVDKEDAINLFHKKRKKFNCKLLQLESKYLGTKVLYSGECNFCKECKRKENLLCCDESKIRYSLESLGFDVSEICENILHEKLNWQKDKKIEQLFSIGAALSNIDLDVNEFVNLYTTT